MSVSPTSLLRSPQLGVHRHRRYTLALSWEGDDNDVVTATIDFVKVEAYRVTHAYSLTKEMISTSYGKLVEIEDSAWLAESLAVRGRPSGTVLRHVRITFDDGPCYEFLCSEAVVKVTRGPEPAGGR